MMIDKIKNKIAFIIKQNLKKQSFEKEYKIKFDKSVSKFIMNYSSKIPKELDIYKKDLLADLKYSQRVKYYKIVKEALNYNGIVEIKNNVNIDKNIKDLERDGITNINFINFEKNKINNFLTKIDNLERFLGHTIHHSEGKPIEKNDMEKNKFYCFETRKILELKEVQDFLNDKNLKKFILDYFGCLPTLNSLNVYVTTESDDEKGVQFYHRDNEDFKTLNIFFLLKDTKKNDGGHAYIKGSHNPNSLRNNLSKDEFNLIKKIALEKYSLKLNSIEDICNMPNDGYGYEKIYDILKKNYEIDIYGNAGRIFAEDNFGLHRSIKNKNERIIFWLSFSLTSMGVHRYCLTHNILRNFIPKRISYSKIKDNVDDSFFDKYVYRYYINFLN